MMETLGWIGSILFALCALPQALHSIRHGHSDGLTWGFLGMWLSGEIFTLAYVASKQDVLPLIANYAANLVFLTIIIGFKIFPRNTSH
jgi:uncharacterized protein with PQ loop repeat